MWSTLLAILVLLGSTYFFWVAPYRNRPAPIKFDFQVPPADKSGKAP